MHRQRLFEEKRSNAVGRLYANLADMHVVEGSCDESNIITARYPVTRLHSSCLASDKVDYHISPNCKELFLRIEKYKG